jgi:hypothetical protein
METTRAENSEPENNPEQASAEAVATVENRDASDPVLGSEWIEKAKSFGKTSAKITGVSAGVAVGGALFIAWKLAKGLFNFAKESAIGKMNYGKGYQLGQELFEIKKDNK